MTDVEQLDAAEAARDGQPSGTQRVVLRCVDALVLDDLAPAERAEVASVLGSRMMSCAAKGWIAEASCPGTVDVAVKAHAGASGAPDARAGTYKALAATSWYVPAQVIEPPLP